MFAQQQIANRLNNTCVSRFLLYLFFFSCVHSAVVRVISLLSFRRQFAQQNNDKLQANCYGSLSMYKHVKLCSTFREVGGGYGGRELSMTRGWPTKSFYRIGWWKKEARLRSTDRRKKHNIVCVILALFPFHRSIILF